MVLRFEIEKIASGYESTGKPQTGTVSAGTRWLIRPILICSKSNTRLVITSRMMVSDVGTAFSINPYRMFSFASIYNDSPIINHPTILVDTRALCTDADIDVHARRSGPVMH